MPRSGYSCEPQGMEYCRLVPRLRSGAPTTSHAEQRARRRDLRPRKIRGYEAHGVGSQQGGTSWLTAPSTNNGVNVQALLDARDALTKAPQAAQFKWRAACEWKNGTHSHSTVESFYGLGEEQHRKTTFKFDADHPEVFASEDKGATPVEYVLVGLASCLTAGIAAVAQNRNIQLKSVTATIEGDMDLAGHPRHRQRGAQRLQRHHGEVQDRCRREARGYRGARRAVAEAVRGLRHRDQSDERHGPGELIALRPCLSMRRRPD